MFGLTEDERPERFKNKMRDRSYMEKDINFFKNPKVAVEIKHSAKRGWYVSSLKINADTIDELDNLVDLALHKMKSKIDKFNTTEEVQIVTPSSEERVVLNDDENKLFEYLRKVRMNLAIENNCPPYIIFHDSTLKNIVRQRPQTKEEMSKIEGVGEKKAEKYGEIFLKAILEYMHAK